MRAERALRLATRGSRLALWQADHVAFRLQALDPSLRVERVVVQTTGDLGRDRAPRALGEPGLFTLELERALADGTVDLAVHSLKDLPTRLAPGLGLAAVLEREDPRDALVAKPLLELRQLPPGARVGTSSLRRRSQLLALRPDLDVRELRGNLPTRLQRLDRDEFDALVLARAGLLRLGLEHRASEVLEPSTMLPAPGQGALALQARQPDRELIELLGRLEHAPTRLAIVAERALLARLEGGCQVPVGALATFDAEVLTLEAFVGDVDGSRGMRERAGAAVRRESDAAALGVSVAERLLAGGAGPILARLREAVAERALAGVSWEEA